MKLDAFYMQLHIRRLREGVRKRQSKSQHSMMTCFEEPFISRWLRFEVFKEVRSEYFADINAIINLFYYYYYYKKFFFFSFFSLNMSSLGL